MWEGVGVFGENLWVNVLYYNFFLFLVIVDYVYGNWIWVLLVRLYFLFLFKCFVIYYLCIYNKEFKKKVCLIIKFY